LSTSSYRLRQLEEASRKARATLGERKSDGAWNDGLTMSAARALEYALGDGKPEAETIVDAGPLSRREREVVAMVAAGMTNRQIAERLFIAERTAEGHVERIRNKLGVRSRTEVATWAVEHGIDKSPPPSSV
jgi:non-specific serine/threonine protein kinase